MQPDLIFDIGLHRGLDARFYMAKGFRVVGVEASSQLCDIVRRENEPQIRSGALTVVERALRERSNELVKFFINPEKDDWGSLDRGNAEKGVGHAQEVCVNTISLKDLLSTYGEPYYIKCDIEGGDAIFVRSLLSSSTRPPFVSVEATSADDIARLFACGYDRFQVVNQYMNPWVSCPNPAREGSYVEIRFTHEMSGTFGRELPPERWTELTAAMRNIIDWYDLRNRDNNLAIGWLDIHCTTAGVLSS
jgi:FkbM family methyltransferase